MLCRQLHQCADLRVHSAERGVRAVERLPAAHLTAVVFFLGLGTAQAGLLDDGRQFPVGTSEQSVMAHFAGRHARPIEPGYDMSGVVFLDDPGSPTFYFCHGRLTSYWTRIQNANLVTYRHLVMQNESELGPSETIILGNVDVVGQEWAKVVTRWKQPEVGS